MSQWLQWANRQADDERMMSVTKEQVSAAYQQFGVLVLRRCLYILGDRQRAEDAMQEVFVRFIKYGDDLEQIQAPVRWFYRIAENVCFDLIKEAKRLPIPVEDDELRRHEHLSANPMGEIVGRDLVVKLFAKLSDPVAREVLLLYYRDGLTQQRIAAQLNYSRQTIHNKLTYIKEQIAKLNRQPGE